jgi:hypothetical protein
MGIVVWHITEKGFVLVGFDERFSRFGDQQFALAAFTKRWIGVGGRSDDDIESLLVRSKLWSSQVPFSEETRGIARVF